MKRKREADALFSKR